MIILTAPVLALAACHSAPMRAGREDCAPVTAELPINPSADGLAGDYTLRLIATTGTRKGAVAEGPMSLHPLDSVFRSPATLGRNKRSTVVHALFGAVDIDLASLDAVRVGSTTSLDPTRPGILVIERHDTSGGAPRAEITLRLGSEANRREVVRFDGGYTALYVREISGDRFAGEWASGVSRTQARGHFCATRVEGR